MNALNNLKRERESTLAFQRKKCANSLGKRGEGIASAMRGRNASLNVGRKIENVKCPKGECVRKNKLGKGVYANYDGGMVIGQPIRGEKSMYTVQRRNASSVFYGKVGGRGNAQQFKMCQLKVHKREKFFGESTLAYTKTKRNRL